MDFCLSGNSLKTFHRSITCLARIGTELVLEASPSTLVFHTINSSRSAYQSVSLTPDFFDSFAVSGPPPVLCSFLLKAVCAVLRTPVAAVDRLVAKLASVDASKAQFGLECYNGVKKTYWITCNVEPDIQHLSLDKGRFPSSLVVRPRDLSRLLGNFQSSLQEITIILTEPNTVPSDAGGEIGGKAVELRSYIDPTKDNSDAALHTQLWIDPSEEFVQYIHTGDPVDVTFSVKELKAFLAFCEGCEVDMRLFFTKAGEPILLAPKFGVDDSSTSDFDATLVLASMLVSQLREGNNLEIPPVVPGPEMPRIGTQECPRAVNSSAASDRTSDHTKIWSELTGSGPARDQQGQPGNQTNGTQNPGQVLNARNIRGQEPIREVPITNSKGPAEPDINFHHMDINQPEEGQVMTEGDGNPFPRRRPKPSNWVEDSLNDEEEEDEEEVILSPKN